jgi:hypothetical protein
MTKEKKQCRIFLQFLVIFYDYSFRVFQKRKLLQIRTVTGKIFSPENSRAYVVTGLEYWHTWHNVCYTKNTNNKKNRAIT